MYFKNWRNRRRMIPLFMEVKQYPGGRIEIHMPAQQKGKADWDPTELTLSLEIASCKLLPSLEVP
jgi:hypothetical protein